MHPQSHGNEKQANSFETIVIGGGQAGLAAGYQLAVQKRSFVILDENQRTGDTWRMRWDSLRLFTPSQFDGLPGFPFPGRDNYFPSKDEVADYLEQYAGRFQLPVRHGAKVEEVRRDGDTYLVSTSTSVLQAKNVVVATGPFHSARTPDFAARLDEGTLQLHASAYCNPSEIRGHRILIVGAANSGTEIALELAQAGKEVWLAGRDVGRLPSANAISRAFGGRILWWLMSRVLTINTPIGRKARPNFLHHGHPLGRAQRDDLSKAGVKLVGRVVDVREGRPQLEDGSTLSVECVIWATGYRPDYRWISLPVFEQDGYPRHWRGVVADAPGLYFLGLPFATAFNSALLGGVGADAAYIARQIVGRNGHA